MSGLKNIVFYTRPLYLVTKGKGIKRVRLPAGKGEPSLCFGVNPTGK
jgi:hypothetical protein